MKSKNIKIAYPEFISPALKNHIGWKIRTTAKAVGLNHQDIEDLESAIIVGLYRAQESYKPSRGSKSAFERSVVRNVTLDFLKSRAAAKRANLAFTLDAPVESDAAKKDGEEGASAIDLEEAPCRWDGVWMRMDIKALVTSLPHPYCDICRYILADYSISEIPGLLGVTSYKFYTKLLPEFRRLSVSFLES